MMGWRISRVTAVVCLLSLCAAVSVTARSGQLEMIGVPEDVLAGQYDSQTKVFRADLTEIPDAFVRIVYNGTVIEGRVVEWNTEDDYLKVQQGASVVRKDMRLTGELVEYFRADELLTAADDVRVMQEDTTITADSFSFFEPEERAEFRGNVVVEFSEGVFRGGHLVLYVEDDRMEFLGPFSGEFRSE